MIELVFVIVVLGILAAIAIPKFAASRTDAMVVKGRSDVASIRSGIINERQKRLILGDPKFITESNLSSGENLFSGVLTYPIHDKNKEGHWHKNGSYYQFRVGGATCKFKYHDTNGTFVLDNYDKDICLQLVH